MRAGRWFLIVALLLVVASGCGDDGGGDEGGSPSGSGSSASDDESNDDASDDEGTGDEDEDDEGTDEGDDETAGPYIDAFTETMTDPDDPDEPAIDEDSARCFAIRVVAVADASALDAAGISPEAFADADSFDDLDIDLTVEAEEDLVDAVEECISDQLNELFFAEVDTEQRCLLDHLGGPVLHEAVVQILVHGADSASADELTEQMMTGASASCLEQVMLSEGVGSGDLTLSQAECIADDLDDEVARRMFLAAGAGEEPDQDDFDALTAAFAGCGVG